MGTTKGAKYDSTAGNQKVILKNRKIIYQLSHEKHELKQSHHGKLTLLFGEAASAPLFHAESPF